MRTAMLHKIKVRKIGGSLTVIIPKTLAEALAIEEGDELYVSLKDEGLSLTTYDPDFTAAMENAREFMRTHKNAFRHLAK